MNAGACIVYVVPFPSSNLSNYYQLVFAAIILQITFTAVAMSYYSFDKEMISLDH